MNDSVRYHILRLLERDPTLSQRQLARALGFSLGKTNYCLRAVVGKGWIEAGHSTNGTNKAGYTYTLTPTGLAAKSRIARRFLDRKVEEYRRLEREIRRLQSEVEADAKPTVRRDRSAE